MNDASSTDNVSVPLSEIEYALAAVVLTEPRTIIPLSGVIEASDFRDGMCARIFAISLELAHAGTIPNPYTVAAHTPELSLDSLLELQKRANPQVITDALALAQIVQQEASYRRVVGATADINQRALARPADLDGFIYHAITMLGMAVEGRADRPSDLASIGKEVDAEMASASIISGAPTGFKWLTDRTGGFRPGHIIALIAPYKGRKTTVARNMALTWALNQKRVCWYALEGSRAELFNDFWAMLATQRLRKMLPDAEFEEEAYLDGMHLHTDLRTPAQHAALQFARKQLDDLAPYLSIADGRDGIANLERFDARVKRDRFLRQTDFLVMDHLQLMSANRHKSFFETIEATVRCIQQFATNEGVTSLILSQMNENAIGATDDAYSPGAKGGGALPAAADYVLTTAYDGDREPDRLALRLKMSRRAQPGRKDYFINPSSGLVLREAD